MILIGYSLTGGVIIEIVSYIYRQIQLDTVSRQILFVDSRWNNHMNRKWTRLEARDWKFSQIWRGKLILLSKWTNERNEMIENLNRYWARRIEKRRLVNIELYYIVCNNGFDSMNEIGNHRLRFLNGNCCLFFFPFFCIFFQLSKIQTDNKIQNKLLHQFGGSPSARQLVRASCCFLYSLVPLLALSLVTNLIETPTS